MARAALAGDGALRPRRPSTSTTSSRSPGRGSRSSWSASSSPSWWRSAPSTIARPTCSASRSPPRRSPSCRRRRGTSCGAEPAGSPLHAAQSLTVATTEDTAAHAGLHTTISGLPVEPLYSPANVEIDYERDLGLPGEYPFTRGVYPSMYRGRLWTMRQFAGFGTAEETNARFRYLLEHGQTGLSTAFDMPTLMGYDSDHPRALGEVGREGVAIDSLADMETLFEGIPLGEVSTSMTINSPAAILLAFYVGVGDGQGVSRDRAPRNGADRHPQGVHRAEGVHLPARAVDAAGGRHDRVLRARAAADAPDLDLRLPHPRGGLDRGAGARVHARRRVRIRRRGARARASTSTSSRPRLSFFFNAHIDFFEEIAKYRAARRIWARELRERYGAQDPRSWLMRFHTQTAGVSLTAQQPHVNIVRTAIEALAAVLGGHAVAAHELVRRGARAADRGRGAARAAHPAGDRPRDRGGAHDRSARRQLVPRGADQPARGGGLRLLPADRASSAGWSPAIKENFFQREIAEASFRYQSEVEAEAAGDRRRQPLRAGRGRARSSSCASTRRSSASRSSGCGRCARGATRPRSRRRSRG